MDYREAMESLARESTRGSHYGLERMRDLMERLDHPERRLKAIHVVGTNGKGSTLSFLDAILTHAGLATARYTSPAVFDYRERYLIKGEMVSEDDFARAFTIVSSASEGMTESPSAFELETATAYLLFSEAGIDVALIEAGCGGRDDATNVLSSSIALLTPISLDHASLLGNTIEEIAQVKADIIKKGSTALSAPQAPSVARVIKEMAQARAARLIETSPDDLDAGLVLGLSGEYQRVNAALAQGVARLLDVSDHDITCGLAEARNPGRFERIREDPVVILDGAHNPGAARALKESLERAYPGRKFRFLMGIFKDKDHASVLDEWLPIAMDFTTFTPPSPRALPAPELAREINEKGGKAQACLSIKDAVASVLATSTQDDIIVATGSLSHLSLVRKEMLHHGA